MRRRGSILVTVLLLLSVLFVLGIGFMYKRLEQYRAAVRSAHAAQARALALAGLEQVRIRLDKDPLFPLPGASDQNEFGFSEEVLDGDGEPVGSFSVVVDSRYARQPYYLLVVTSTGQVISADPNGEALARRSLRVELDLAPDLVAGERAAAEPVAYSNSRYWEIVSVTDLGGF